MQTEVGVKPKAKVLKMLPRRLRGAPVVGYSTSRTRIAPIKRGIKSEYSRRMVGYGRSM
jgi:hypothetical protein